MDIEDVIELCNNRRKIKGTIKEGCILDDSVILWSMNAKGDSELEDEYNMIKELEKYELPVVEIYDKIKVKIKKRIGVALIEELLQGKLFKPHNTRPIKLNDKIKEQIQYVYNILNENEILIEDLQWIYNEKELKIIDPYKVYKLNNKTNTYIILGAEQDKRPKSFKKLRNSFEEQLYNLEKLI